MTDYTGTFEQVSEGFRTKGIGTDTPGFYDDPKFLFLEQRQPDLLNNYARFVAVYPFTPKYLERAECVIREAATELHRLLLKDGRKGACIDCSMAFSRMLDEERIWNYAVNGAVTIHFAPETGLEPFSFWPIDQPDGSGGHFGHKWVCAPPFNVVDITIHQQDYDPLLLEFIPDLILSKDANPVRVSAADICAPDAIRNALARGVPPQEIVYSYCPHLRKFFRTFPATMVDAESVILKYVPCGIGASDCSLEKFTSLKLNGLFAGQIYKKHIAPKIARLQ